jgi:hypothetical protein
MLENSQNVLTFNGVNCVFGCSPRCTYWKIDQKSITLFSDWLLFDPLLCLVLICFLSCDGLWCNPCSLIGFYVLLELELGLVVTLYYYAILLLAMWPFYFDWLLCYHSTLIGCYVILLLWLIILRSLFSDWSAEDPCFLIGYSPPACWTQLSSPPAWQAACPGRRRRTGSRTAAAD